jgi:hypothetical protein
MEKRKREIKAFIFLTGPVVRIGFDLVLLSIGGAEEARDEQRRARPRWATDDGNSEQTKTNRFV